MENLQNNPGGLNDNFQDVYNSIKVEAKSSKSGVDIGDGIKVHKVGNDPNGNWSYWISRDGGKQKKIQTTNLEGGKGKLTDVRDFGTPAGKQAVRLVKDYVKQHMKESKHDDEEEIKEKPKKTEDTLGVAIEEAEKSKLFSSFFSPAAMLSFLPDMEDPKMFTKAWLKMKDADSNFTLNDLSRIEIKAMADAWFNMLKLTKEDKTKFFSKLRRITPTGDTKEDENDD